jgi:hypothetical protein
VTDEVGYKFIQGAVQLNVTLLVVERLPASWMAAESSQVSV